MTKKRVNAKALRLAREMVSDPDTRAQIKVALVAEGKQGLADLIDECVIVARELIRLSGEGMKSSTRDTPNEAEVTPWFPAQINPVCVGVYAIDTGTPRSLQKYSYWDGQRWGFRGHSRPLPTREWLESWAAYFEKRAEDMGGLHIGSSERYMIAQTFRDMCALVSERTASMAMQIAHIVMGFENEDESTHYTMLREITEVIKNAPPAQDYETNEANARLIAAAPDLLAALETVKRVLQGEQVFDIMLSEAGACLGDVVRDAIEKASGTAYRPEQQQPMQMPTWMREELQDGDRLCSIAGVQRTEGGRLPVAKIVNSLRGAPPSVAASDGQSVGTSQQLPTERHNHFVDVALMREALEDDMGRKRLPDAVRDAIYWLEEGGRRSVANDLDSWARQAIQDFWDERDAYLGLKGTTDALLRQSEQRAADLGAKLDAISEAIDMPKESWRIAECDVLAHQVRDLLKGYIALRDAPSATERSEYICKCGIRVTPHRCQTGTEF